MQNGQEVEAAAAERQPVKLSQLQVARRVDADKEDVGVNGMKRDEVADVGFEAADLLAARVERMDEADLVTWLDRVGISRA